MLAARRALCLAAAAHPASLVQVYVSRSRDARLNLAVEHALLLAAPPRATVLVLYANSPCVVVGRNQNPWLEAHLARLAAARVALVRRRSGGGAVFHDAGNVNYSVACAPAAFDRDAHAHMVVRALAALGCAGARVNERHDIVVGAAKVSGSAYKLTRRRALHHGTCLLRSANVARIGELLRSPAAPYVRARGVESVRSRVANVGAGAGAFADAVVAEFARLYGRPDVAAEFGDEARAEPAVRAGYDELAARAWTYGQTPRFSFATHPDAADARPRPPPPFDLRVRFEARHGLVERFDVEGCAAADTASLAGLALHDVADWGARLAQTGLARADAASVGAWMDGVLGTAFTSRHLEGGSGPGGGSELGGGSGLGWDS